MLQTIRVRGHVGSDGLLKLEVPLATSNQDVEAVVVIQVLPESVVRADYDRLTPGFFEALDRLHSDDLVERLPQGEFEARESLE